MLIMFSHYKLMLNYSVTFASFNRGQPLAWQTKVVRRGPGCFKAGLSGMGSDCCNEAVPSKPTTLGRGIADVGQSKCSVTKCDSNRCKTCNSIMVRQNFTSNLTGKKYTVVSLNDDMDCGTTNVIYLIECNRCGIQYIGKTCQTLRSRFNNHRSKLKQLCDLYLYNHFNSDGHNIEDIRIMPIEVMLTIIVHCPLSY